MEKYFSLLSSTYRNSSKKTHSHLQYKNQINDSRTLVYQNSKVRELNQQEEAV